ncbi:Eri1 exoribonuclease 3 [Paragonimus heterotremus]|uniref:Eri1 exoribonuclease 3 n=1 Tax=Paragonimus heterotremus TaxID=100268 RepID=A0A8J4WJZ6_9TREM|nr:Eri1 exoribonuclease 3 [Paragonimus heterotremus]
MAYFCEKKDNIPTLEDVCVRFVCKNLNFLTFVDGPEHELRRRWRFPYPNFRISPQPAQKILLQLCKRNALDDERMSLFSSDSLNLISPVIKEANVSPASLRVLKEFRLSNLSAMNLPNVNLNSIIGCLGEWTVHNLISLNVTGTSIMCETNLPILVVLGRFKNLQVLNVSRTEFTTSNLQIVADDLSNLQHLNISRTRVTDISPLLAIRDRLTGLIMHRLELEHREDVEKLLWNIVQLHQLRTLDVSDRPQPAVGGFAAVSRLCSATALPHLVHLDLSGNPFGLRLEDARVLVANHPKLVFVGFASWLSNHEHELEGIHKLSLKYPGITMLGDRGDQLLLNTLTRNKDRAIYLQNALHSIFEATSNRESLKPDLLQAVLRVMRLHLRRMEMILAGTAVIYNLTRSEQSGQLPLELLNRAVRMTLTAMEKFPKNRQLQKNCFLTLCSDTVLYRATFNCSQCCELVFNNLIAFDDVHMKRMGVAIISILAAEISTAGLSELAKDRRRIQCLLMYVAEKCLLDSDQNELEPMMPEYFSLLRFRPEGAPIFDTTLRFTLSALWNLTDECPEACLGFVQEGGLQIYEKVLKRFADQEEEIKNHVYTKCLGLLNNVAEVEETRNTLLVDSLMDFFFKMLRHPNIQISYFAAGIIAHLSCLKDEVWHSALQSSKESYIKILGQSVCSWKPPQSEMVAYRSFEPFEKVVLHPESRLEVHLWAVWAIHHILTRKEARYVPTLCHCERLLNFLRYVVSVDETVLCANCLQRQTSTSSPQDSPEEEQSMAMHFSAVESDSTNHSCSYSANLSQSPRSGSTFAIGSTNFSGSVLPGSAGDGFPLKSESDTIELCKRERLHGGPAPRIGLTSHSEPVGQTTAGVFAFAGPDSAQLACARLIRSLAFEIVASVDRTLSDQPTANSLDVITLPS